MCIRDSGQVTGDGFAYRVDMRLRPFGEVGALALSFDAMEHYYQTHGREWERYAPVSYTHLDVYKRQVCIGSGMPIENTQINARFLNFTALLFHVFALFRSEGFEEIVKACIAKITPVKLTIMAGNQLLLTEPILFYS